MFSKSNMSRLRSRQKRVKPLNYQKNNYFYSDGSQREVTVNWSEVPASSYQKEGIFTVVGRAAGVSMPIIANVKVTAKHIVGFKELPALDRLTGTSRGELNLPTE